eukprot:5307411-Pleurochrysis_carterae.AAC.2
MTPRTHDPSPPRRRNEVREYVGLPSMSTCARGCTTCSLTRSPPAGRLGEGAGTTATAAGPGGAAGAVGGVEAVSEAACRVGVPCPPATRRKYVP